jgi:broad specificity phosphatase PhoE
MMELLIVTHGVVSSNNGLSNTYDGALTEEGIKQVMLTAGWMDYNFRHNGYVTYTSPFFSCLQTATFLSSKMNLPCRVELRLRDMNLKQPIEYQIENRSLNFPRLQWNVKQWDEKFNTFPKETIQEFVSRCVDFLASVKEQEKVMVVTHSTPAFILSELSGGKQPHDICRRCQEVSDMANKADPKTAIDVDKHIIISGIGQGTATWVVNNEVHWYSKPLWKQE